MVRTVMKYFIEQDTGRTLVKRVTPRQEKRNKNLQPKGGKITLWEFEYTLNPLRMRRERYRFHLRWEESRMQYWRENDPEPIDLFVGLKDPNKKTTDITGDIIKTLSRSERLKRLVQPKKDWTLLIMGLFMGLFIGYLASNLITTFHK